MDSVTKIKIDNLYAEAEQWKQNTGGKTIHAKRSGGKFRLLKWIGVLVWLPFFLTPYIEWNGRQAILFDMDKNQYHLFNVTIFSQDLWVLAMILLFLAIILAAMTTMLGRVFCGYFCFQTVWTDIFTKIEEFFEGSPNKRRKLDESDWNANKIRIKTLKHIAWISIALLSGGTWMLYFGTSWSDYFDGTASMTVIAITGIIALGAYLFAGFMREQTCLWICPYARIQGVMLDKKTIIPTYDYNRGESRGRLSKGKYLEGNGDCIDCNQCVAVCPTGVDIRKGQEYGCITCGLCIDACNSVMKKVDKPPGLIRYTSLEAITNNIDPVPPQKRMLFWTYLLGLLLGMYIVFYSLTSMIPVDFKVIQERAPLFVELSDGTIRNKYQFKIMNISIENVQGTITFKSDDRVLKMRDQHQKFTIEPGKMKEIFVYLTGKKVRTKGNIANIDFILNTNQGTYKYTSVFISENGG